MTNLPEDWLGQLTDEERRIAIAATRLHDRVELFEACYHYAFFLAAFLKREYRIETTPVVGWINDGRDPICSPHAWLEYDSKKTDISLTRMTYPDVTPPGALLVLDRQLAPGAVAYIYHVKRPFSGTIALSAFDPDQVAESEHTYQYMNDIARSQTAIRRYLDDAPSGLVYADLRRIVLANGD